ncbi:MAG: T9SS type A sorting domain-containing protein [Ferruginibacter sp.]
MKAIYLPFGNAVKKTGLPKTALVIVALLSSFFVSTQSTAQVSTYYIFNQSSGTYTPGSSGFYDTSGVVTTTPASIYTQSWDDIAVIFRLPFAFNFNGTTYAAGTGRMGLDTDGWVTFSNGNPTMTGQLGGGSWISASNHTGMYLYGTANNNGFAGYNCDLNNQDFTNITANRSNGSNSLTNVSSFTNIRVGTRLSGTGIPNGTIVTAFNSGAKTITMSANATSTGTGGTVTPSSSIYAFVTGTAPNRKFVIQWTQAKRYGGPGTDDFNFQMILSEGGGVASLQTLEVIYSTMTATDPENLDAQIGLRGATTSDFNARKSLTSWAATTTATANTDLVRLNNGLNPAAGLTFTWSPCTTMPGLPGVLTGTGSVCTNGTTYTYTVGAATNATYYNWSYSGTGATFTTPTGSNSVNITFAPGATSGTLSVTAANLCGTNPTASTMAITVAPIPTATNISYPASVYCTTTAGTIAVTRTGVSGGTYSASPSGLTIDASTGAITPSTSSVGVYLVTYTYTSGSCSYTTTTTVRITSNASLAVSATATPSSVCSGSNSQLQATITTASGYSVSPTYNSILSPSGSPTVLWNSYTDDAISSAIAMPFTFNYFGSAVSQVYVSTNGYIMLNSSTGATANPSGTIPYSANPNNLIALGWHDMVVDPTTNPGAYVRYFTNGTTPNRVLVIDYNNVRTYGVASGANITGQIRLYESDGHIEIAASSVNDGGSGYNKVMGIEDNAGTTAYAPTGRNYGTWNITSAEAWSFDPITGPYTYSWSPGTFLSSTTISNPMANAVTSSTSYTVTVTATSTGCSATAGTSVAVSAPLSGTYTVGTSGNYPTLTAAVNAYNTACLTGPVTFSLISATYSGSETFPITINNNASASSTNTLTIKPAAGINATISGSNATAILKLNGAKYVTINGSNSSGNTRNLTISNTNTGTSSTVVWLNSVDASTAATNNTVKNCTITGNAGTTTLAAVMQSGSTVGATAEAANNNNNYFNNLVSAAMVGINLVGATGNENNNIIDSNFIGSTVAASKMGSGGIRIAQQASCQVIDNTIAGATSSTAAVVTTGIGLSGTANGITISGNKISDIKHTTDGCNGIYLGSSSTGANVDVFNNFVFDVAGKGRNQRGAGDNGYGIMVDAGGGYDIYYNTVNINTSQTSNGNPACINIGSGVSTASSVNIKNNIFSINQSGGGQHYSILCTAATSVFGTIDYNDYYTSGANLAYVGGSSRATLALLQSGFGQNTNSINVNPTYISATDYHIDATNAGNISNLKNKGNAITGFTTDYDATTRNGLTPDMGADEWVDANYGSWVGKTSTSWTDATNWEANYVPDQTTDVYITGGYTYMPSVATTQAVRDLNLSAPVPANTPVLTINAGTLQVYRTINRTGGSIDGSNGTMEMKGSAAQSIPASLFVSNNLKNLIISNTDNVTGVSLAGALDIYRSLTFGAGGRKLTTGGNLTLKSTETETAWLGQMTASNTISGSATVERNIPQHSKAWQFLSTPITAGSTQTVKQAWQEGATTANGNPNPGYGTQLTSSRSGAATQPTPGFDVQSPGNSIKVYNKASGTFIGLNRTDTAISNPKGYMVFVRGDRSVTTSGGAPTATTLRMKGTLHTPANPPVTVNVATAGLESVGNPYASAINFRQLGFTGGVQNTVYYVWDPKLTTIGPNSAYGYGGFQTFTWNSGTNTFDVTPGGGSYASSYQYIESGQAFFINAPLSGGTLTFSETAKVSGSNNMNRMAIPVPSDKRLRTNMYAVTAAGPVMIDGNMVQFHRGYSNTVDIEDAVKISNTGENLGLARGNKLLAVEKRKPIEITDTIFYKLGQVRVQEYQFEFIPTNVYESGLQAWLEDSFLHTSTAVSLTDTTRLNFNVINNPGSYNPDRFRLVFIQKKKQSTPATDQENAKGGNGSTAGASISAVEKPAVKVYPNPVTDGQVHVQLTSMPAGTYSFRVTNQAGQVVYEASRSIAAVKQDVVLQLSQSLAAGVYQLAITDKANNVHTQQLIIK